MRLGIDRILSERRLQQQLTGKRIGFLGHPASVTSSMVASIDALMSIEKLKITAAFGPQHGMRGDKQDNMIESDDYHDPKWNIPVFSLYGKIRRPSTRMVDMFDLLLVDLQDVGTRVYTFLTTTCYFLEVCAAKNKTVWILDRPNPAGRHIEGLLLDPGWESFVGVGRLPMRHGLTLGEIAEWYVAKKKLNLDLKIVKMTGYCIEKSPWPNELGWVNPSPNASSVNMTRCYPGTVMIEGTNISEGRGTTKPLEIVGCPGLDHQKILNKMRGLCSGWLDGCYLRHCYFEPTFHKHHGSLCEGLQLHVDGRAFSPRKFKPFRLIALYLKAIEQLYPDFPLWRSFVYEYEADRLAFDVINGGQFLRQWIEDNKSQVGDLAARLTDDEKDWQMEIAQYLLY